MTRVSMGLIALVSLLAGSSGSAAALDTGKASGNLAVGPAFAVTPANNLRLVPAAGSGRGIGRGGRAADPARIAWARQYGQDRDTMPMLAPVTQATAEQRSAASDLLTRTIEGTSAFKDLPAAKAAGYDLEARLARLARKRGAGLANGLQTGAGMLAPGKRMPMVHVANPAYSKDGRVLDPAAPETLMYQADGRGGWTLVGAMFKASESFPSPPPAPGGPITRWHYHDENGAPGGGLMMHVFFTAGNDLSRAFATTMGRPALL